MKKTRHSVGDATARRQNGLAAAASRTHPFLNTVKAPGRLHGLAVKEFCDSYGVTYGMVTRLTGFSQRAVANWAQGRKPSESTERRLTELNRMFESLGQLISKETIGPWLKEPNSAFDGSTPLQVIERGESDRIWRMIYELESGEPG